MPVPVNFKISFNSLFVLIFGVVYISQNTHAEDSFPSKNDGAKILGSTYFRDAEFKESELRALPMLKQEREHLRDEAREMFYHGYNSYMDKAYPADELMPLSCKGRWRHLEPSRGDIDDVLGNFSMTLVDSLDMLVVLGDLEEFEKALKLIIKDVSFDTDVIVSVFETNIRMVGGLLSGHILAEHLNQLYGSISWYRGELLSMAQDLARRLLPAFNTTTGIPHPRVNLKYGMKSPKLHHLKDTCTACAGTIILEFASLSRLSGEPIFEEKARIAMDYLWSQRHRGSDLVGTVLNIHNGDWIRRDSGVGAGIDSYYEYLFKAYILLGDEGYLERFNKHYNAVMKYVSQGPMLLDVHMHRPHTTSRNFMDALLAFWPGLQVLKGDIKPAIETHEMLYQVIQRHNFLPEAFTTDFQIHWGQHPLRPEFVESTYLLFEATGDPYYLRVGEKVLKSLQKYAWVPCGYAAVNDVRTGVHEDRMDSFVLTETFKYLYLLFAEPSDLIINLDEFIFTTEAHLLPLSLARLSNITTVPIPEDTVVTNDDIDVEYARSCPNTLYLFSGRGQYAETIRKPMKNYVSNICPNRKLLKRKLRASEFQAGSPAHLKLLANMGITIMTLKDGRVQLLHTASNAKSNEDAEEGLVFMQEMIELSKLQQDQPENPARAVSFSKALPARNKKLYEDTLDSTLNGSGEAKQKEEVETFVVIVAGPAQFGVQLDGSVMVVGPVVAANPIEACQNIENQVDLKGKIVIMKRGGCMFVEKARRIEALGAAGGIVLDNSKSSTASNAAMFAMSGDGTDNVKIPLVFLFSDDAKILLDTMDETNGELMVSLTDYRDAIPTDGSEFVQVGGIPQSKSTQATGPMVKSALKKQSSIEMTCKNMNEEKVDTEESPLKKIIDVLAITGGDLSLASALRLMEKSSSAEELLAASLNFVNSQLYAKKEGTDLHLQSSSILSDLQMLILKKTANNPTLLRSLLTQHLNELSSIFKKATQSDNAMENSLQLLLGKLMSFSSGQKEQLNIESDSHSGNDETDSIDIEALDQMVKSDPEGSESLLKEALLKSMRRFNSLLKKTTNFGLNAKRDGIASDMAEKIERIKEMFSYFGSFRKSDLPVDEKSSTPSVVEINLNKENLYNDLNAFSDQELSSRGFKGEIKFGPSMVEDLKEKSSKNDGEINVNSETKTIDSESLKSKSSNILDSDQKDIREEL